MKTRGKKKRVTPLLLNLCTRWMWGRKLHAQAHLRLGKYCCTLDPTAALDVSEIEKYLAAAGIRTPDPPSRAVVITQNTLSLLPEADAPKNSRQSTYEGGKFVKRTHLVLVSVSV